MITTGCLAFVSCCHSFFTALCRKGSFKGRGWDCYQTSGSEIRVPIDSEDHDDFAPLKSECLKDAKNGWGWVWIKKVVPVEWPWFQDSQFHYGCNLTMAHTKLAMYPVIIIVYMFLFLYPRWLKKTQCCCLDSPLLPFITSPKCWYIESKV
jgi:hypothetical protein